MKPVRLLTAAEIIAHTEGLTLHELIAMGRYTREARSDEAYRVRASEWFQIRRRIVTKEGQKRA